MLNSIPKISNKSRLFIWLYIFLAALEVYVEYLFDKQLIWIVKPLVLPALFFVYRGMVKKMDTLYSVAMFFGYAAGVILLLEDYPFIVAGASIFIFHRILLLIVAYKNVEIPGVLPIIIGAIPFIFSFIFLIYYIHDTLADLLWLFVVQGIVTSVTGGLALANYMLYYEKTSRYLLISVMFSAATQFLFTLRLYHYLEDYYQPITMCVFYISHLFLCRFMVLIAERKEAVTS